MKTNLQAGRVIHTDIATPSCRDEFVENGVGHCGELTVLYVLCWCWDAGHRGHCGQSGVHADVSVRVLHQPLASTSTI